MQKPVIQIQCINQVNTISLFSSKCCLLTTGVKVDFAFSVAVKCHKAFYSKAERISSDQLAKIHQ